MVERINVVEGAAQDRPAVGVRRREEDLVRFERELLLQRRAGVLVNGLREAQQIAGQDDGPMAARVFEGQHLDPQIHHLAVGRVGAGGVARHPERLCGRDVGSGGACLPERLIGGEQRAGEPSDDQHPNNAGAQEVHPRQLFAPAQSAQGEKPSGAEPRVRNSPLQCCAGRAAEEEIGAQTGNAVTDVGLITA